MTDTQTPERIHVEINRWLPSSWGKFCQCYLNKVQHTVPYIRADLHAAVVAERDQLKAKLTELENHRA